MIDITRLVAAPNILAMANQLAEQRRATALPAGVAPSEAFRPPPPKPDRTDDLIAASLAAGVIAGAGIAVTAKEAVQVFREVREALGQQR